MTDNTNCAIPAKADLSAVVVVKLNPQSPCRDYLDAMRQANDEASRRLGEHMLLSWYDRDRDSNRRSTPVNAMPRVRYRVT